MKSAHAQAAKKEKIASIIKRIWGGIEVTDATTELRVMILPEDVQKATRKDPSCCVFAQACIRCFGAGKVLFYRTVAYVELPNADGTSRVERFIMPKAMRDLIAAFDVGEGIIPKAGFILKPPAKSDALEFKRLDSIGRGEERRRRRLAGETITSHALGGGERRDPAPVLNDFEVRNGSGAVQFSKAKKKK